MIRHTYIIQIGKRDRHIQCNRIKSNLKGDDDESDEDVDKEEGKDNEVDDVEQRHLDPGE